MQPIKTAVHASQMVEAKTDLATKNLKSMPSLTKKDVQSNTSLQVRTWATAVDTAFDVAAAASSRA